MDGDEVGAGVDVPIDRIVGIGNHEMNVERNVRGALTRFYDGRIATTGLDVGNRAVQMRGGLRVDGDEVGAGVDVPIDRVVGIGNNELNVDRDVRGALTCLYDGRAVTQIRHEVTIHDVNMDQVRIRDALQVVREVRHIGREDGRGTLD